MINYTMNFLENNEMIKYSIRLVHWKDTFERAIKMQIINVISVLKYLHREIYCNITMGKPINRFEKTEIYTLTLKNRKLSIFANFIIRQYTNIPENFEKLNLIAKSHLESTKSQFIFPKKKSSTTANYVI